MIEIFALKLLITYSAIVVNESIMSGRSVYQIMALETQISIQPSQMDSNMENHMLQNLKRSQEKYTSDVGIVMDVIRILDYGQGRISDANFLGIAVFPVRYEARVCCPTEETQLVCEITNIMVGNIAAINGPIKVNIYVQDLSSATFSHNHDQILHKKSNHILVTGDMIIVSLVRVASSKRLTSISTIGIMLDMASQDDKDTYIAQQASNQGKLLGDDTEFI